MSQVLVEYIEKLHTDFANIISLKLEISKTREKIKEKLLHLKNTYQDLVKVNTKKLFVFCLDSFFFQYKIFSVEIENIDRFCTLINNRMYCEFYKLYNIIALDINEKRVNVNMDLSTVREFPVYKDLEPFYDYNIDDIKDIHKTIIHILNQMYEQFLHKTENIDNYNDHHRIGFSISNFINTLQYENKQLNDQIMLYINYMSFFQISQRKLLNRIALRINEFYNEVDSNINVNRTFSINDIESQVRMDLFYPDGDSTDVTKDPESETTEDIK